MIQHLKYEKGRAGDREEREPDPLWKIFAAIEFAVTAERARAQRTIGLSGVQLESYGRTPRTSTVLIGAG